MTGATTTLAYYQTSVRGIAVDGSSVYWAMSGGDIMKTPIGGGPSKALVVSVDSIAGIAVDSTSIYWANPISGTVMKLAK